MAHSLTEDSARPRKKPAPLRERHATAERGAPAKRNKPVPQSSLPLPGYGGLTDDSEVCVVGRVFRFGDLRRQIQEASEEFRKTPEAAQPSWARSSTSRTA